VARSVDYATGRAYFYFKAFFKRDPYKLPAEPRKPLKRQISIKICIMKTIATNYKLTTNGKKLRVELVALFRAVGIGGDVSEAEVPGNVLDTLRVQLVRPNVTGAETLTNDPNARCHYSLDGSNLDVTLAGLTGGVHRLTVLVGYGTNSAALLIADLEAPDNVLYLVAPGDVSMPLERYPDKDVEADGVSYYAYRYAYGNKLAWLITDKPQHLRGTVEAYYVADMTASLEDATELEGARLIMNYDLDVYDSSELVALSPVDTFGSVGGGGGSEEAVKVTLSAPSAVAWENLKVKVIRGDVTTEYPLNAGGVCTFSVPLGEVYTIVYPIIAEYMQLRDETFTALQVARNISHEYSAAGLHYEKVEVHGRVITADQSALGILHGLEVRITAQTESGQVEYAGNFNDSNYVAIDVPYGLYYTVHLPEVEGWQHEQSLIQHTSGTPSREILVHYSQQTLGVFGIDEAGATYTKEEIDALEDKTIIKAVGVNTSALAIASRGDGTYGAGFCMKLPITTASRAWATANVQFDTARMPFYGSLAVAAGDYKGVVNSLNMEEIAEELVITAPAATYTRAQYLTIGGVDHQGFLGAFGQMYVLAQNYAAVKEIVELCGHTCPNFVSGYWWSSSQYNATSACGLGNGGFNGNNKDSAFSVVPFFDL